MDVYEEAADKAKVPAGMREEVVARVRRRSKAEIVGHLADEMHEVVCETLAQDGRKASRPESL